MRTPGPWEVDKEGRAFVVNSQIHNGDANDQFYGGELIAESIFNPDDRKLIAAAPELLEACKAMVLLWHKAAHQFDWGASFLTADTIRMINETPGKAQIAIAKAEGME